MNNVAKSLVVAAGVGALVFALTAGCRVTHATPVPLPKSNMSLDSTVVADKVRLQRFVDPDHGVVCYVATMYWSPDVVGSPDRQPTISCVKP